MNLEALRVFRDVIRLRSFSKAAKAHGITQSAASQSVRHLEKEVGVELVDRSHRPLGPTESGRILARGCAQLLEGFDRLLVDVRQEETRVQGTLGLATIYSVGLYGMGDILDRFRVLHPDVEVEHDLGSGKDVARRVESGEAEVGILSYPRATRTLEVVPLPEQPFVLACDPGNALTADAEGPVMADELQGARFLAYAEGLPIRRAVDRFLKEHGVRVQVRSTIDNSETLKRALREIGGASLLPAPNVRREARMGTLATRPLGFGNLTRPLGVLVRKGKKRTPVTQAFLDLLAEEPELWTL